MKDVNIIVFGDSITYGASDNQLGGWVNRLRIYLENKDNREYNVFNLGISGQITEEILDRFDFECKTRFNKADKTILIFAIGINDTQVIKGKDRISEDQFKLNIKSLISKAQKFTNDIIFVGLTQVDETRVVPFPWNNDKSCFNKKIIKFDNIIENICKENSVSYLKIFDLLDLSELEDGLHPNSVGHDKIFNQVLFKVNELLK